MGATNQHSVQTHVSRKLTLMKLLSKYINQECLKLYYNSYILPIFDFCCIIWGNTTVTNQSRLIKLQKRVARLILKADILTPSDQMFKELIWLSFPKRVYYHTCLMVYKGMKGQSPEYISSILRLSQNTTSGKRDQQQIINYTFPDLIRQTTTKPSRSQVHEHGTAYQPK